MSSGAFTVQLWGVRGSVPSPGFATRRHGGNTPCVSVRTPGGRQLVLDAGTGVRALGEALLRDAAADGAPLAVDVFLTHVHWDHVQGLPFFAPLYARNARLAVHSPTTLDGIAEDAVRRQMLPPSFPVPLDAVAADITFHDVAPDGTAFDEARLRPIPVNHPGGAVGWRVERADGTPVLAYLPDNEIDDANGSLPLRATWLDALRGIPLLIHDATYTPDDLATHRGWGHSSWEEAVRLAADAGVERLVLFHHHPDRSDHAVDAIVRDARALAESLGAPRHVLAAAEGVVLHVA